MKQTYKTFIITILKWIFFATLIGTIVGTLTTILLNVNDYLGDIRTENEWLIFFLPLAGIVVGYIYMHYGKSNGNDCAKANNLVIEGVQGNATILKRMGPIVYIGTFITVLFGGSTGREGAAIQMGGSVAETINQKFKVNIIDKKDILMSGISAGFGAAFGTPITGTIFGMEMFAIGKMKYQSLVLCSISSFVSHYVSSKVWGLEHEKFIIESVPDLSSITFAKIIMLSILFGLIALLYCQLRHAIQRITEKLFNRSHIKRAFLGGIIIVILMLIVGSREYNGRSLELLEQSFKESVPVYAFLAKLVFTAVTMGTGFVGGEAIPLFIIGATLGNVLSVVIGLPMSFLAALGLIAVFCGGTNTPIAAFILGIEMFNGKGIEFFFIACIISYIVSGHHGLWPSQTIHDPKRRLYNLVEGETIHNIENRAKDK